MAVLTAAGQGQTLARAIEDNAMPMFVAVLLVLSQLLSVGATAPAQPRRLALEAQKYWVYCIGDKVSVEMWDLEQMKVRRGSDVCQLHESTSMSGAMSWMEKNFPTHTCSCQE